MKIFKTFAILSFLIGILMIVPSISYAQSSDDQEPDVVGARKDIYAGFDVEMPDIPYFTKDEIIQKMQFFEKEKPSDDEYSGYRLFVPKSWEEAPEFIIRNTVNTDGYILGEVAKYYSNPNDTAKSTITIEAIELEHNISARNWLLKHILDYGYVLEGIDEKNWNRAEALGVMYNDGGIDYKDRVVAQINGKRIILFKYSSPLFIWEQEKQFQSTVAKSFRILNFAKSFQEDMLTYDVTGYAEFQYPANWSLGNLNQNDFDRPSIKLINLDDYGDDADRDGQKDQRQSSKGLMNIQIVLYDNTGTSITDEIEVQKNIAESIGIRPGKKLTHDVEITFPNLTEINRLDIYEGVSIEENNPNYEIWVAYMKNEEAYYFVTMMTPTRGSRYFAWTENKSAFEAVVSSLEPISFYEE